MSERDYLLAATVRQAHLTAEIDWHWKRVGFTEYETLDGKRVSIATSGEQLRGLPRGTVIHFAYDAKDLPWTVHEMVDALLSSGDFISGKRW